MDELVKKKSTQRTNKQKFKLQRKTLEAPYGREGDFVKTKLENKKLFVCAYLY